MKIDEGKLKEILQQVEHLDDGILYSGLMILSKDLSEFFAANGLNTKDVTLFREVYTETLNIERDYWEKYGNELFQKLSDVQLPEGFALSAGKGNFDLSYLTENSIQHEWLHNPGRKFLTRFAEKFKETICGKDGPYEKLNNGLVGQADLPISIASSILSAGLSVAAFWYPIAVYIGLLLIKAGLKTYCETGKLDV